MSHLSTLHQQLSLSVTGECECRLLEEHLSCCLAPVRRWLAHDKPDMFRSTHSAHPRLTPRQDIKYIWVYTHLQSGAQTGACYQVSHSLPATHALINERNEPSCLSSQPRRITALCPVLISRPTEGRRLSWPRWLVTYRGRMSARRWSPIPVATDRTIVLRSWTKLITNESHASPTP